MLHIQEIRKNPDGLTFEQGFDLTQEWPLLFRL